MSGCVSEWISARALPSCSPPPPRYFSLLGTEGKFLEVIPVKRNSGSQAPQLRSGQNDGEGVLCLGGAVQLLTPPPARALTDGNVVEDLGRSRADKEEKSERADPG